MADIFISYSSEDKTYVKGIVAMLEQRGWSVWWDRQIPIGQRFDNVIEEELAKAYCVIVIWTKRSVASEWVKNEASEASQLGKLVPLLLEDVTIPLAFRRTEAALLNNWSGEMDHPELALLFNAVEQTIEKNRIKKDQEAGKPGSVQRNWKFRRLFPQHSPLLRNILLGATGIIIISVLYVLLKSSNKERDIKNVTIRVFDHKNNPLTQGDVKIYLDDYIRSQSIDKMGQALFAGIPPGSLSGKLKIEVSSPGFATKQFDTVLKKYGTIEITIPYTTVVFISGAVKTASEMPIRDVEINVDGTRYFARSITDGTYSLRLDEYTLGDEITLTTSHPGFEDKTVSLRIGSPDIRGVNFFLQPVDH